MLLDKQRKYFQLTSDHSLVQEKLNLSLLSGVYNYDREQAKNDPQGNVITRTVGFDEQVEVDVFKYQVKKNDFFILCSDGLHGKVTDERILEIFSQSCPEHEFTQVNRQMHRVTCRRSKIKRW